jgi:hypothetical protein
MVNADWFLGDTDEEIHARQVAHIKTTVQGQAFDHLIDFLERNYDEGTVVTALMCRQYLKKRLDDPDRRVKARDALNALKLPHLGNFATFHSEFVRLAQASKRPVELWKEDLHDKLYADLQIHLEFDLRNPSVDFDTYCERAQFVSRGVERAGKQRKEAAEARRKARAASPSIKRTIPISKPTATSSSTHAKPADSTSCFVCQSKDHWAKDCPMKKKTEAKVVNLEEVQEEEFLSSDSENEYP